MFKDARLLLDDLKRLFNHFSVAFLELPASQTIDGWVFYLSIPAPYFLYFGVSFFFGPKRPREMIV